MVVDTAHVGVAELLAGFLGAEMTCESARRVIDRNFAMLRADTILFAINLLALRDTGSMPVTGAR